MISIRIASLMIFVALLGLTELTNAQDRIIKRDGSLIEGAIVRITESSLEYRLGENEGPIFEISLANVHKVILASGDSIEYNPLLPATGGNATDREPNRNAENLRDTDAEQKRLPAQPVSPTMPDTRTENTPGLSWSDRSSFDMALYVDVKNSGRGNDVEVGGVGTDNEVVIFGLNIRSFTPVGTFEPENAFLAEHGYVINSTYRYSYNKLFLNETQVHGMEFGGGYGVKYNTFDFQATLNSTAFVYVSSVPDTGESFSDSEFFPSDSAYLRMSASWYPKQRKFINNETAFNPGVFVALDSFFAGGNAFLIGFTFTAN